MFDYENSFEEESIADAMPETLPLSGGGLSYGGGMLSPISFLVGIIGLLVLMHFIGRSAKTDIQPAHLEISGYNVLGVTAAAIVGIVTLKLVFNKWQVPGLTDLLNAV